MNTFHIPASFDRDHLCEQALGAFGGAPAKVALPTFCTNQYPRACQLETLRGCFMGL